ncbi:MAG: allantoate amidohydrolase [Asticcacaulis sp.]|nr:allantoate amidohydrolase [Asticcacaulis sp.]
MVKPGFRAKERCDGLGFAPFSDSDDHLFRPYLGPAHLKAIEQVAEWMRDAGMTTRIDPAGNLVGRWGAGDSSLIIGSHIDSVRDAGKYDGPLGVMLGIECVEAVKNETLPFAIEVYAFGDEEGSRFPAAMLSSRAVCGQLDASALQVSDRDGITLAEALSDAGLDISRFLDAKRDSAELLGYLEAHIEQGPVLEAEGLALGTVTAIAAQRRYEIVVTGIAGHAGTNAMSLRKDALTAAAEMVLAIEAVGGRGPGDLVATVGTLRVEPGAPNVVPGRVVFTIDVRAGQEMVRDSAAEDCLAALDAIAARRGIGLTHRLVHDLPASPCDPRFMDVLAEQAPRRIVSGAGHDAMVFAKITPSAMLFIRCKDGVSHNPLESVTGEDCQAALEAMVAFIRTIGETE